MKEKIKMDELIKLLNEFENTDNWENRYQVEFRESKIISKKFWFIQWLVDNDKINWSKYGYSIEYIKSRKGLLPLHRTVKRWDSIIMLLSIKDKPLEFLVSILK